MASRWPPGHCRGSDLGRLGRRPRSWQEVASESVPGRPRLSGAVAASGVRSTYVPGGRAASRDHLPMTASRLRAGGEGSCRFCRCGGRGDPSIPSVASQVSRKVPARARRRSASRQWPQQCTGWVRRWAPGACARERGACCTVTVFACRAKCCVPHTVVSPCGSGGAVGRAPGGGGDGAAGAAAAAGGPAAGTAPWPAPPGGSGGARWALARAKFTATGRPGGRGRRAAGGRGFSGAWRGVATALPAVGHPRRKARPARPGGSGRATGRARARPNSRRPAGEAEGRHDGLARLTARRMRRQGRARASATFVPGSAAASRLSRRTHVL